MTPEDEALADDIEAALRRPPLLLIVTSGKLTEEAVEKIGRELRRSLRVHHKIMVLEPDVRVELTLSEDDDDT